MNRDQTAPSHETAGPRRDAGKSRARSLAFGALRFAVGIALLAVLGSTGMLDWRELGGLITEWQFSVLALLVIAAGISATAWRLCILVRPRGFALGLGDSLRLTFIGTFFNLAMPGSSGGDLVRIYYAARGNEGRRAEIVTVLLLDRFIGLLALLMYPVILTPLYLPLLVDNQALRTVVIMAAALIGACGFAVWLFLARETGKPIVAKLLGRIPGGRVIKRMVGTLKSYGSDRRPLRNALLISLGAHALGMSGFVFLARAVVSPGLEWFLFVIVPVGMVVNTVPLTPGGLGVGETAFAVLFGLAGIPGGPEVLLSWRIVSIVVGLAGLVFYLQGRKQFVSAARAALEEAADRPRRSDPPPSPGSPLADVLPDASTASPSS